MEVRRAQSRLRDKLRRLRGRIEARFIDRELAELAKVRRVDPRRPPSVLALGDSAMFFVPREDRDARRLDEMVRYELPGSPRFMTLAGPGYNPRVFGPYLDAIERAQWRPDVVLVTVSTTTFLDVRLDHPSGGYQLVENQLRSAVHTNPRLRRLGRPSPADEAAYDRQLTPSLCGPPHYLAEVRLLTNARPATPRQTSLRAELLLDAYLAQRLDIADVGAALIERLGSDLARMRVSALLCIAPLNHRHAAALFGPATEAHLRHNAGTLAAQFLAGAAEHGDVLDATFLCPPDEFADPLHLNDRGRRRLAAQIAPALSRMLRAAPASG